MAPSQRKKLGGTFYYAIMPLTRILATYGSLFATPNLKEPLLIVMCS